MKDRFQRDINYLRVSVTNQCNYQCMYCFEESKPSNNPSDEELIQIITEFANKGVTKIRFTGGEPTLRKGLFSLIKRVKEIDGITEVGVTTNGSYLMEILDEVEHSGVDHINISINSLNPITYQNITNHPLTFDISTLIKTLQNWNINMKINVVLLNDINISEIENFIRFSFEHQVGLRFIELMDFKHSRFDYETYYMSIPDVIQLYPKFQYRYTKQHVTYYQYGDIDLDVGFIGAKSTDFCDTCNKVRITSDGYIKSCLHHNHEVKIELKNLSHQIDDTIQKKPKEHQLKKKKGIRSKRSMNQIGG